MKLLVLISIIAAAAGASQRGYQQQIPSTSFRHGSSSFGGDSFDRGNTRGNNFGGFGDGGFSSGGFGGSQGGAYRGDSECGEGEVVHIDGSCVRPIVNRQVYVYAAPAQKIRTIPPPELPKPKINYNIVFVRTPQVEGESKPLVVPPPQQKTLVYVLNKRPEDVQQEVIEVSSKPTQPEVYFINYGKGDNPQLPGGIDLQHALTQSVQQGQIIEGDSGIASLDDSAELSNSLIGSVGTGFVSNTYSSPKA